MDSNDTCSHDRIDSTAAARSRLWLAGWLARRPDVMARLVRAYHRLKRRSLAQQRRLARGAAVTLAGAALLLALSSAPAADQAITVVDGEVAVLANGKCSLIEAIDNANNTKTGRPHKDCAAGNPKGADTINLPQYGSFQLVEVVVTSDVGPSGTPWITSEVTINGNRSTIYRSMGAPEFRIMQIGKKGRADISDLTLRGAKLWDGGGGGLLNQGAVTMTNCRMSANEIGRDEGGAIHNTGTMTIRKSGLSHNESIDAGGAIYNKGTMHLIDSFLYDNRAGEENGSGTGAAIYNSGEMTIIGSSVGDNVALGNGAGGGITNWGTMVIKGSSITGNLATASREYAVGGGINNNGTIIVEDTLFKDNKVYVGSYGAGGGGLHNSGIATVIRSTFDGNSVMDAINGRPYYVAGGGILNTELITISNSTIVNNEAEDEGAGIANFDRAAITGTTISRNRGGGIATICNYNPQATTWISRSLVSGNLGGFEAYRDDESYIPYYNHIPPDYACTDSSVVVNDFNIFGVSGNAGVNFPLGSSDIVPSVGLGSILAPLADNGGPTWTHALVPGSPAIDRAPSAACAGQTDQRGYARNADGDGKASSRECDIGAFEYKGAPPQPTPTATQPATATPKPTATATAPPTATPDVSPTPGPSPTAEPSPTPGPTATETPGERWRVYVPMTMAQQQAVP